MTPREILEVTAVTILIATINVAVIWFTLTLLRPRRRKTMANYSFPIYVANDKKFWDGIKAMEDEIKSLGSAGDITCPGSVYESANVEAQLPPGDKRMKRTTIRFIALFGIVAPLGALAGITSRLVAHWR
jgi:hypothetical protein